MTTCPSCNYSVPPDSIKCANCGMHFDETSGATAVLPHQNASVERTARNVVSAYSTQSADGARFAAGTILADRYRVVNLLGRGGMGEVYKAEDLKLKQIVALKFLPEAVALDGAALARFQNEVRITRQISHPNVCRVYDIGEANGMHFLSMEYIDGEDLSLLLRRIGRLPGDKANEIARQICAGLAAAHDNGVLHRDLKPANIMIDGRGRARITDFGVAVVAKELIGGEAASGTPAYMAPEQLTGKEVSQKSDLYSLGLVLYELFTGKRVFNSENILDLIRLHETTSPTSPSTHVEDLDPLVERVILRCLEKDPAKRPASAIQVAAALPGGDPLAAALAAGETPSPEMVAASGEKTGLRPAVAAVILGAVVAVLIAGWLIGEKIEFPSNLLRDNSPDTLAHQARDIIQRLGYTEKPLDSAFGFDIDTRHQNDIREKSAAGDAWRRATEEIPAPLYFWYRESPRYLEPLSIWSFGGISEFDPNRNDVAGMTTVRLDPAGRLRYLMSVPRQVSPPQTDMAAVDWSPVFKAAGLDLAAFTPTASTWMPASGFDTRAAWTGTYPEQPNIPVRVEAAAYQGRPTYFNIIMPWARSAMDEVVAPTSAESLALWFILAITITPLLGALVLARMNLKRGRGDRKGAIRLSLFVLVITLLAWVVGADHRPTNLELARFAYLVLGQAIWLAAATWVLYIALEPYVRRRWPETIVSWTRAVSGTFRDPLVGRDVLVGLLAGVMLILTSNLYDLARMSVGALPRGSANFLQWLGTREFLAFGLMTETISTLVFTLVQFFFLFVIGLIARRRWLAGLIYAAISTLPAVGENYPLLAGTYFFLFFGLLAVVAIRFGLLAFVIAYIVFVVAQVGNYTSWFMPYMITVHVFVLALAGWSFHTSLGGQKLFSGSLLDD